MGSYQFRKSHEKLEGRGLRATLIRREVYRLAFVDIRLNQRRLRRPREARAVVRPGAHARGVQSLDGHAEEGPSAEKCMFAMKMHFVYAKYIFETKIAFSTRQM